MKKQRIRFRFDKNGELFIENADELPAEVQAKIRKAVEDQVDAAVERIEAEQGASFLYKGWLTAGLSGELYVKRHGKETRN